MRYATVSGWTKTDLPLKREKSVATANFRRADAIDPALQTRLGRTSESRTSVVKVETAGANPFCLGPRVW